MSKILKSILIIMTGNVIAMHNGATEWFWNSVPQKGEWYPEAVGWQAYQAWCQQMEYVYMMQPAVECTAWEPHKPTPEEFIHLIHALCSSVTTFLYRPVPSPDHVSNLLQEIMQNYDLDELPQFALAHLVRNHYFIFDALGILYSDYHYRLLAQKIFEKIVPQDIQALQDGRKLFNRIRSGGPGANFDNINGLFDMSEQIGLSNESILRNSHFISKANVKEFDDIADQDRLVFVIHKATEKILSDLEKRGKYKKSRDERFAPAQSLYMLDLLIEGGNEIVKTRVTEICSKIGLGLRATLHAYVAFLHEKNFSASTQLCRIMYECINECMERNPLSKGTRAMDKLFENIFHAKTDTPSLLVGRAKRSH